MTAPRPLFVHLLPALVEPDRLRGGLVVVVDVLRASTTIAHALSAGATRVLPAGEIDEARRLAAGCDEAVLGGERGGRRIDGFDLGNSPTDYTPASVGGRTVVFTTTNGTRALIHAATAERILVGCFANERTIANDVLGREEPVHVLCAGTDGEVTLEDVLFAGSLATALLGTPSGGFAAANDSTRLAERAYAAAAPNGTEAEVHAALRESRGGRNLLQLGYDADLITAADRDSREVLPVYDPHTGTIAPAVRS